MTIKRYLIITFIMLLFQFNLNSQDRYDELKSKLDKLAYEIPALEETVNISVNGLSVHELIRGIANSVFLNINIDPNLDFKIVNNFSNVKVKNILLFICKEYDLEVSSIGSILSLSKYEKSEIKKPTPTKKEIIIKYNHLTDLLSLDFNNDSLARVAKEITKTTKKNVIVTQDTRSQLVSIFIEQMPFYNALEKFAFANELNVTKTKDNFYLLSKQEALSKSVDGAKRSRISKKTSILDRDTDFSTFDYEIDNLNNISINANKASIQDLVKIISDTVGVNYCFISDIEGETEIKISDMRYEEFLIYVFDGTEYSFSKKDGIYLIGDKSNTALYTSNIIHLQYRTVVKIIEYIPEELKKDLEIIEFPELNCLLVNGSTFQSKKIRSFIQSIDKVVPVILIEILIVDVNKSHTVSTGIQAGIGENVNQPQKTLAPGIKYNLSTESINNLFKKINGFGWINLGKVSPEFYLNIKALEDNGDLKVRSTPKLSTLNGHEATLKVGETKYYKEERNNYIGTQNPQLSNSFTWKAIDADLSIIIKPIVSGDDQITLEIEVEQSEFTPREFEGAPPGSVTRKFQSLIRMKNQEMILLGGLDKVTSQNISQGMPLLSRIPILKWFFSSKTQSKSDGKLSIFIQPTIVY